MANIVDLDQMLQNLDLHCLSRTVCPNTKGYYGMLKLDVYDQSCSGRVSGDNSAKIFTSSAEKHICGYSFRASW